MTKVYSGRASPIRHGAGVVPPVPLLQPPRISSWDDAKPPGAAGASVKPSWLAGTLPPKISVVHSVAPYPSRKWVQTALNSFAPEKPAPRANKWDHQREPEYKAPVSRFLGARQTQTTMEQKWADENHNRGVDQAANTLANKRYLDQVRRGWTPDELESLILEKIQGRTAGNGLVFQAFRLFNNKTGNEEGITPADFRDALNRLLMCGMTEEECRPLFDRYDTDGGGTIDVYEFMEGIMRPFGCASTLMGNNDKAKAANDMGGNRYLGGTPRSAIKPPPKPRFPVGVAGLIRNSPSSPIAPWPDPEYKPEQWNSHPNAHLMAHDDGNQLSRMDLSPAAREPRLAMSPAAKKGLLESESFYANDMPRWSYVDGTTQAMRPLRSQSFAQDFDDPREVVSFPFRSC